MLDTVFLTAAVIGGTVMVCQFFLTLLGIGDDGVDLDAADLADAADAEFEHDSSWLFGVLSFRTLIAAAAFFGISGKAATSAGISPGTSLVIAVLVGLGAMYGMYWLMQGISHLASSGNERINLAIGKHATVYVAIPPEGSGIGKVQVTMQNRILEYQAVSKESEPLRSGETVEVVSIRNSHTLEVRRISQAVEALS